MRNKVAGVPTHNRPIRWPEFARRIEQAADQHSHCPPKHSGRLPWVVDRFEKHGMDVTTETVRKWFAGESLPRQDKIDLLAKIFEVDPAWLQLGQDQNIGVRERKVRDAMADGAVNLVAGFIQMDGGYPAFPDEDDKAAQRNNVDLHAIIRGAKYDLHVSLGQADERHVVFPVPTVHENVIVLGVVREGFNIDVFELTPEVIAQHGVKTGGSITVTVDGANLRRVETFARRL